MSYHCGAIGKTLNEVNAEIPKLMLSPAIGAKATSIQDLYP
jgi:hypothetical protein